MDGVVYAVTTRFNERDESWYMDVALGSGATLLKGVKLVGDWPLIGRFHRDALPDGEVLTLDNNGQHKKPVLGELGERVALIFATDAEIATAVGG